MLHLKGKSFIKIFLELYDSILKKIKEVNINNMNEADFREEVDVIAENMKKKANDLDEYLVKKFKMNSNINIALKLIRATVYCFLAERLNRKSNSFHQ